MEELDQLCHELGTKQTLGAGERISLAGEEELWLVLEGQLSIHIEGPSLESCCVCALSIDTLQEGDFLARMPAPYMKVLCVEAVGSCKICRASLQTIQERIDKDPLVLNVIEGGLRQWIDRLARTLKLAPPSPGVKVVESTKLEAGMGLKVSEEAGLRWVSVKEGLLLLNGFEGLFFGPEDLPIPIVNDIWYMAEVDTELSFLNTKELIKSRGLAALFGGLGSSLLHALSLREVRRDLHYADLVRRRKEIDEEKFQRSLAAVAAVLEEDPSAWMTPEGEDLLFASCQLLGEEMGIEFRKPPQELTASEDVSGRLEAICHHSGLRKRQVSLKKSWWRKDGSSFLGFFGSNHIPVTLLRRGTYYKMVETRSGSSQIVDEDLASQISPIAFTFYFGYPESKISVMKFFRSTLRKSGKDFRSLILLALLVAAINLFVPLASKILFDNVIPDVNYSLYGQVLLGLVAASLGVFGFALTRSLTLTRLEGILKRRSQMGIWDRIFRLPAPFFRKFASGDLVQRIFLVDRLHQLLSGSSINLLLTSLFSMLYLVMMFVYSWKLSFIGIAVVFVGMVMMATCIAFRLPIVRKVVALEAELNSFLMGVVRGIGKLRTAAAERRVFAVWAIPFARSQRLHLRAEQIKNFVDVLVVLFTSLGNLLIFWAIIAMLRADESFSVGTFIAFTAAYSPFAASAYQIMTVFTSITESIPLWARSRVVFETEPESAPDRVHPGILHGDIAAESVSFRYGETMPEVVSKLSLHISPGEYLAIVGSSGSGKSTLLRLLLGFERPIEGEIFFDNKSLKSLDLEELRGQCGVIMQGRGIFDGSLADNLTCGRTYTPKQMENALFISGFEEDLKELPMGLDTVLLAGGAALSGGQRQRLLLARALVSEPHMLILDEATSFLDSASQRRVAKHIRDLTITRIVASHQLGAIKHADRICVIQDGGIVEEGSYEALLKENRRFVQLFSDQIKALL